MAYRLPSERVPIEIEDGPTVEVEKIGLELTFRTAVGLASAYLEARDIKTLRAAYRCFVYEAQPTWDIVDHHGPVPQTVAGMLRLPVPMGIAFIHAWASTFIEKASAVDEMIPPSPLRDELKRRLKQARKAA